MTRYVSPKRHSVYFLSLETTFCVCFADQNYFSKLRKGHSGSLEVYEPVADPGVRLPLDELAVSGVLGVHSVWPRRLQAAQKDLIHIREQAVF